MLYYVECDLGCTLVVARSEDAARNKIQKEIGTMNNVTSVCLATDAQIAWVNTMGGHLPDCKEITSWKKRRGVHLNELFA